MRLPIILLSVWPGLVLAEDWVALTEDGAVRSALEGHRLSYPDGATQTFDPSGVTLYVTSSTSEGRWAARGGQYCSQWPPSETWACYDLLIAGDQVRFAAPDGSVTDGLVVE